MDKIKVLWKRINSCEKELNEYLRKELGGGDWHLSVSQDVDNKEIIFMRCSLNRLMDLNWDLKTKRFFTSSPFLSSPGNVKITKLEAKRLIKKHFILQNFA